MTFAEAMAKQLRVLDQTAYALCDDGDMPIIVFDIDAPGALTRILEGGKVGTLVHK